MKILLCDSGMPFDLDTPYNFPLGGSEISLLLLAKGLVELGNSVVLLNSLNMSHRQEGNLLRGNLSAFNDIAPESDVIIFNRSIVNDVVNILGKKPIYYWAHDAYDQKNVSWMANIEAQKHLNKIFCVSEWQKNTFADIFNIKRDKIEILPNPIDKSLYFGTAERNLNKLIFSSIPYKGLSVIGEIFNNICIKTKKELNLKLFSSMKLYGQENEEFQRDLDLLSCIKGVEICEPVSMKQLAYEFSTSNLYIHPSTYHETFGRVFIESMAAGCLPVTLDVGANKEVINNYGFVLNEKNILNKKTRENFENLICEKLSTDLYVSRINAEKYSMKYDYLNVANGLIKTLEKEII